MKSKEDFNSSHLLDRIQQLTQENTELKQHRQELLFTLKQSNAIISALAEGMNKEYLVGLIAGVRAIESKYSLQLAAQYTD